MSAALTVRQLRATKTLYAELDALDRHTLVRLVIEATAFLAVYKDEPFDATVRDLLAHDAAHHYRPEVRS